MFFRLADPNFARYGAPVLALGMALLAARTYRPGLEASLSVDLSFLDSRYALYLALAMAMVGGSVVLLWTMAFLMQSVLIELPRSMANRFSKLQGALEHLSLATCDSADMQLVSEMARQEFGELAADHQRNLWLAQFDGEAYTKIIDRSGRIIGFYDVFKLSRTGTQAIQRGEFDISNCPREYLRSDKRRYANLYIAGIYGKNIRAKAMVLGALNQRIIELRPRIIFARAATKSGLRALEDANFAPVNIGKVGQGGFYMRKGL